MNASIQGVIFDKDGTLFDFASTWGRWVKHILLQEARDADAMKAMAETLGYDVETKRFTAGSIVVAEPVSVIADHMRPFVKLPEKATLIDRLNAASADVPQVAVCDLCVLFDRLLAYGLTLGVATNDGESPARAHLKQHGVVDKLTFIAGFDSGFVPKPAPGQLVGFCAATGLAPSNCVMVGDSVHDLKAGLAAGMICVGVLTGPALRAELVPFADTVLASVVDLPAWITQRNSA